MRDGMGVIESSSGKNNNHLAYAPGKKVVGPYGIDPWTWMPTIGMNPQNEAERREFANNMHLQLKALDNVLEDAWTRSGGDPSKARAVYYGGAGALKKLGTAAGDAPQFAQDDKGNRVQMPSINEDNKKMDSALRSIGVDPETFKSTSTSNSTSALVAKRGDVSALSEILKDRPSKPGKARNDWNTKQEYLVNQLAAHPALITDPRAKSFLESIAKLADAEQKAGDAELKQYNEEAGRYSQAAIAQANLEGEQYRFGQRTADATAARESQVKLNAKKAEMASIENQIKSLSELQNAKWDKLAPEARQAIEAKYSGLFTVETTPSMVPWGQPSTRKVLNPEAISRVVRALENRRDNINSEIAQMGGSASYIPATGDVNPNDFMR